MLKNYSYKINPKLFKNKLSHFSTNKQINTLQHIFKKIYKNIK